MDIENDNTILNRFDNLEIELLSESSSYAKSYLEDEGFDIKEELDFSKNYLKRLTFLQKAQKKKENDSLQIEKAIVKFSNLIHEGSNFAKEKLMELLISKNVSVQYRNLEKWSENEIREVLKDIDFLDFLESDDNE